VTSSCYIPSVDSLCYLSSKMMRRFLSTTASSTSGAAAAPAATAAAPPAPSGPVYFMSQFQIMNNPKARYVINNKPHSVVPVFARDELVPWAKKSHDLPNISQITGVPAEYLTKTLTVQKNARHAMQSGGDNAHHWKLVFPRTGNWVNQLMGWISGGDCLQATGARQMKFDSSDSAVAFANKMGWNVVVAKPGDKLNVLGKKSYDNNFLNQHVKKVIQNRAPAVTMKTQFAHPERGRSSWVNLGQMAVQEKTSTHFMDKKVTGVSQAFWDVKEFDSDKGAKGWRYDNDFPRADEISRKLGK